MLCKIQKCAQHVHGSGLDVCMNQTMVAAHGVEWGE